MYVIYVPLVPISNYIFPLSASHSHLRADVNIGGMPHPHCLNIITIIVILVMIGILVMIIIIIII